MYNAAMKIISFLLAMAAGMFFKKIGVFRKEDGHKLAKVILNLTLPAALLAGAGSSGFDVSMLYLTGLAILVDICLLAAGYLVSAGENGTTRGMYMLNCCGQNIGNFVMPFAQAVFPGLGVAYLCLFDIGGAFMTLGAAPATAGIVAAADTKVTVKGTLKKLFTSVVFDTYVVVFLMTIFQTPLPDPLLTLATFFGNANSFLVFFMIGLLLELKAERKEMKHVWKIVAVRLILSIFFMLISWFVLPLPLLAKKILVLLLAGPAVNPATIFSAEIGYKGDAPAIINSITVVAAIVLMSVLTLVLV